MSNSNSIAQRFSQPGTDALRKLTSFLTAFAVAFMYGFAPTQAGTARPISTYSEFQHVVSELINVKNRVNSKMRTSPGLAEDYWEELKVHIRADSIESQNRYTKAQLFLAKNIFNLIRMAKLSMNDQEFAHLKGNLQSSQFKLAPISEKFLKAHLTQDQLSTVKTELQQNKTALQFFYYHGDKAFVVVGVSALVVVLAALTEAENVAIWAATAFFAFGIAALSWAASSTIDYVQKWRNGTLAQDREENRLLMLKSMKLADNLLQSFVVSEAQTSIAGRNVEVERKISLFEIVSPSRQEKPVERAEVPYADARVE